MHRIQQTLISFKPLLFKEIISQNKIKPIHIKMIHLIQTISAQINLQFLKSCFHNLTRHRTE
jgi:hypothetical protein